MNKRKNTNFKQQNNKNSPSKKQPIKTSLEGPVSVNSKGIGFFDVSEKEKSIEIQNEKLHKALNGDIVQIRKINKKIRDREQGEVIKIISRNKNRFVGKIIEENGSFFLLPDDKRMYVNILLSKNDAEKIDPQLKVFVEIINWDNTLPSGKILKIIGKDGNNDTEMESIVLEKGFNTDFPIQVEKEAEKIRSGFKNDFSEEISKRRDMRNVTTFTIDPFDAKDFDDAISISENKDSIEIGIHIADVSHFVRPESELDKEAEKRGLSVYLVDRTIPMLPEILSNDLCSINPDEDKFTFSAVFKMDREGNVFDKWFGKTIIHSNKRFTYEEAQDIIDNKKSGPFREELLILKDISKKLEKQKYQNGAINFETEEVKFELDKSGKPLRVYKKTRLDTHKLVEEYMLLANKEVAKFIFHSQNESNQKFLGKQSVYRIHGTPDRDKIEALTIFLKALGFDLRNKDGKVTSRDINKLLKDVEGTANEELIKTATIRSMQKAIYSTKNIGHFGLAFRFYTHFTSPIRRYPDLLVHRFLERELNGGKIEKNEYEKFERICLNSSDLEKKASEAERASIKYKQVEYMQNHIGEEFFGTITGVTDWGIYIEENETKCEGMVKLKDLNDYYELDEKNYTLKGKKTGKKYRLGDSVKFKVLSADISKKVLDYLII